MRRASAGNGPVGERAAWLDLFKTLLIWGMVSAHVVQLLGLGLGNGAAAFSDCVNLISFSGYMLAFGIGTGLSRRDRPAGLSRRMRPALIMLGAAYLSSLAFAVLVTRKPLTADMLIDLLSFRVLFGYSEFLATFLVLYVVIALFRPLLVAVAENPRFLVAATALCLASTYVTTNQLVPLAGTIIGHQRYASFPLLPYLPWFLVGIRIGRNDGRVTPVEFALALVATGIFAWMFWRAGYALPGRFPPTIAWVIGPALALVIYLYLAQAVTRRLDVPRLLLAPGRHVLAALLLSNLVIFATGRLVYKPAHSVGAVAAISLGLLVVVTLWCAALDRVRRTLPVAGAEGTAAHG